MFFGFSLVHSRRLGRSGAALILLACCAIIATPQRARAALAEIKTASGAVMLLIPAGEFVMGSASGQADEKPAHRVKLSAFYMDKYLVTQQDYESLMGSNPCQWPGRPQNPVEQVRWSDAARYCNARSLAEGLEPTYDLETWRCDFTRNGYRLPTEAEWEYACRAGTRTAYFFGDKPRMLQIYAWYARNSGKRTRPVGRKRPNPWGLYDMGGNLWQWCNDFYQVDYYKQSPAADPRGPRTGEDKVVRGGSWDSSADQCRSATRFKENPAFGGVCFQHEVYGFRVVRSAAARQPAGQGGPARVALVYDDVYLAHKTPAGHPERPERLKAIILGLKAKKLLGRLELLKAAPAPLRWIETVHSREYIRRVEAACRDGKAFIDSPDAPISADSYKVAVAAVGGVLSAVDAVMAGKVTSAFCAVRPPGHHALKNKAMGFCIFNNVAIAARYIRQKHKLARVLIVDWDVHHGNGTEAEFYNDAGVMYFSVHRGRFYPGTGREADKGAGKGAGLNINVPLPAGAGDEAFIKAFKDKLIPAALKFRPDFILISAGFDAHASDPLGGMKVSAAGFAEMTRLVKRLADKCSSGRIVSVLEGGYDLEGLSDCVEAHLGVLMGR